MLRAASFFRPAAGRFSQVNHGQARFIGTLNMMSTGQGIFRVGNGAVNSPLLRSFASKGKPKGFATVAEPTKAGRIKPGTQDKVNGHDAGAMMMKFLPFVFLNPISLGTVIHYVYVGYVCVNTDEEDERNNKQASTFIANLRQARRESLSDFKEAAFQLPDPKEHYDERTYRKNNYTQLVKTNSFRPGGVEALKKKVSNKPKRTGLYDSEGHEDESRVSGGLSAHREKVAILQAKKSEKRLAEKHAKYGIPQAA